MGMAPGGGFVFTIVPGMIVLPMIMTGMMVVIVCMRMAMMVVRR